MALSSYRELEVWQVAMDLCEEVYRVSADFPADERFGLISQIRRAAVSVPSNIAEGYGRINRGEYVHHVSIARGSLYETETQLTLAVRLGLIPRECAINAWELAQRVGMMSTKLLSSLEK